jgi:hypothetical protein
MTRVVAAGGSGVAIIRLATVHAACAVSLGSVTVSTTGALSVFTFRGAGALSVS